MGPGGPESLLRRRPQGKHKHPIQYIGIPRGRRWPRSRVRYLPRWFRTGQRQ